MERLRTMLRIFSSAIMPMYGLRVRVSSFSSLCSAGSGCSALAAMAHSVANTDSSPVLEAITRPLMNRWSPKSTSCLNCFRESAPISFLEIMPWILVPSPADSCTKHRPPALRRNSTRPAMPTTSSVSSPASSLPSYLARTSSMVAVTSRVTGYGWMPSLSIMARLATRICTCSGWASGPNSLLDGSTASSKVAPSLILARIAASCCSSISARSTVVMVGTAASSSF